MTAITETLRPSRPSGAQLVLILAVIWGSGCLTPVPIVTGEPVPSMDRLEAKDCEVARTLYLQRLAMEPAGPGKDGQAQIRKLEAFVTECRERLQGRARRVVLRCWHDSSDAQTFLNCNYRF